MFARMRFIACAAALVVACTKPEAGPAAAASASASASAPASPGLHIANPLRNAVRGVVTIDETSMAIDAGAPAILKSNLPRLRLCYSHGLMSDPVMHGTLTVAMKLDATGRVVSADSMKGEGLTSDVVTCVVSAIRMVQFDSPGPTGATGTVAMTFAPAAK